MLSFVDKNVGASPSQYWGLNIVGNSSCDTKVYWGAKSGSSGISGLVIKPAGGAKYTLTASDPNITDLGLYGCSFLDTGIISLPVNSPTKQILNCNFESGSQVLASTGSLRYCNFIGSDAKAVLVSTSSFNITNTSFINCPQAVEITTGGSYLFDAMKFSGNTTDIDNTSSACVTVNCVNLSNPTTFTGSTMIVNSVYLTITVVDSSGSAIQNAQTAIYKTSDNASLMNMDTNANGIASTTFGYVSDTDIYLRVRKSLSGSTKYVPTSATGTILNTGFTTKITLATDLNA